MNPQIANTFAIFIEALIVAVVLRSVMTWFPRGQGSTFARLLERVTEPLVGPVRRILPRFGMFDFSPMVVIIALYVVLTVISNASAS